MIFGIGLPRCGGQTLSHALGTIAGGMIYHSIEGHKWGVMDDPRVVGAVEVYAPYPWLERYWPESLYIVNWRDPESWLESCQRVYQKSHECHWNHPIWQYPISAFQDYANAYFDHIEATIPENRLLWWNIIEDPTWDALCDFLDLPDPGVPFPRVDRHSSAGR